MRDPLLHEEPKTESPFLSPSQEDKPRSQEIDSALFLKNTFEENPSKGLELLFRRFYKPLCSHAVRFVYSKQIAEDLVSEVFFQFYRTKSYENITSSYTSYLFRAVRNECFTHLRREFGKTDIIELNTENTISLATAAGCRNPLQSSFSESKRGYWRASDAMSKGISDEPF